IPVEHSGYPDAIGEDVVGAEVTMDQCTLLRALVDQCEVPPKEHLRVVAKDCRESLLCAGSQCAQVFTPRRERRPSVRIEYAEAGSPVAGGRVYRRQHVEGRIERCYHGCLVCVLERDSDRVLADAEIDSRRGRTPGEYGGDRQRWTRQTPLQHRLLLEALTRRAHPQDEALSRLLESKRP